MSDEERTWLRTAAQASVQAQKIFWKENVEECMRILDENGVEIIIPDKSLFANKSEDLINSFGKDPSMKKLMESIRAYE